MRPSARQTSIGPVRSALAALLLCAAAPVVAQDVLDMPPDRLDAPIVTRSTPDFTPDCLAFGRALDMAARNDPAVSVARSDLESAQAGLTEAKSLRRPQLSAFTQSGLGDEGLVNSNIANQAGLRASQRLLDFGDSRLAKEAAQVEILAQESLIISAQVRARLRAGLAYIDWLDATERLDATVERAAYFSRELAALEIALESGGATRSEVAEIGAESADAEADRFELEFEREQALTQLRIATRSEAAPCTAARVGVEAKTDIASSGRTSTTYLGAALADNAQVKALERTAKRLELEAERAARARLPIIEIVGITSLTTDSQFENPEVRERIGFDASIPLYTGLVLSARKDRARAQARRAEYQADEERKILEEQVISTHRRALLLNAQLGRRQAVIEYRAVEFDAARAGYENNIRTLPELVDVRLQFEAARLAEIRARHDYFRQALTLKSLTGEL